MHWGELSMFKAMSGLLWSLLMYRGDAERVLGKIEEARHDYQEAKKRDAGLYGKILDERLGALAGQ
jgi:hypothetical protein